MNSERSLLVYPPVYRLGRIGKTLRDVLMAGIIQGTPVLLQIQKWRFGVMNELMKGVSLLGEEEFYAVLLTTCTWIFCSQLGRLLAFVMSICFYFTGFLKNSLCLPRPPVPPVAPLSQCSDWGFPSHHSVLNVAVPWFIWLYVRLHCDWTPQSMGVLLVLIATWSFSIMFSRLYLAVHSPADILSGGILGLFILLFWLQIYEYVDRSLDSGQFLLLTFGAALFGLSIFPDPKPHSIVISETVDCIGPSFGINLGYYVCRMLKINSLAVFETQFVPGKIFYQIPIRIIMGGAFLLFIKTLSEIVVANIAIKALSIFGISGHRTKRRTSVTSRRVHYSKSFQVLDTVRYHYLLI